MALLSEHTKQIVKKFRRSDLDTGSSEVQIALLSFRIKQLTEHFKVNKQDVHSRMGLRNLVNRRRSLLNYLKTTDKGRYTQVVTDLGLRG